MILIKEIANNKENIKVGIYENDHLAGLSEWTIKNKCQDDDLLTSIVLLENIYLSINHLVYLDGLLRGSLNILRKYGFHHCFIHETLWDEVSNLFQSKDYNIKQLGGLSYYRVKIDEFFKSHCKGMNK